MSDTPRKTPSIAISITLLVLSMTSWMIAFYSGWHIHHANNPEWYHYADAWGFGIIFCILIIPTVAINFEYWLDWY